MLWNGVAGVCRRLCRYLSLFRMSTSVHGKRLRGLATDHRPDSASSTAQTTQGLAVAVSAAASYRADAAARESGLAPAEPCSPFRPIGSMHMLRLSVECRSRQMAVFCAVSANNCSHGAPISLPTSTSTHPRLLRARGRCLGPSTRPYAPQTRLLEQKQ